MPRINDIRLLLHAQDKGLLDQSLVGACVSDMIAAERKGDPLTVAQALQRRTILTPNVIESLFRELLGLEAGGEQVVGSDTFMAMAHSGGGSLLKWGDEIGQYRILNPSGWLSMIGSKIIDLGRVSRDSCATAALLA